MVQNTNGHNIENSKIESTENSPTESTKQDVINVARGGGIAFVGQASARGLSYLYSLVLIWGLGVENFGLFTLAMTIVSFIGILSSLGVPLGIIRFGAITMTESGKTGVHKVILAALKIILPVSLIITITTYFSAHSIARFLFHKPELTFIIQMLSWGIPFFALQNIFLAATRSMKEMKYTTIIQITQPLLALILALVLIYLGSGTIGAVIAYNISFIVGSFMAFGFYRRMVSTQPKIMGRFSSRKLLKFSMPLSISEWIHYANERIEVIFLGMLPGTAAISIYKIAWSLAGLETLLRLSLEQTLAPFSSDLAHRREIGQLESLYKATAKWGFSVALMLFFVYILFGKDLLAIFNITEPLGAAVLIILAGAQLFNEFTGACNTILIMSGRSDLTMINTIILLAMNIILNWWLIIEYGLIGAAIAGAVSVIVINILRVLEVWWTLRIHPFKLSFFSPVIFGVMTSILIYTTQRIIMPETIIIRLGFVVLYCIIFLIAVLNINLDPEDQFVLDAVKQKLNRIKLSRFM